MYKRQQKNKEQSLGTVLGRFWDGFGTVSKSGSIGTVLGTLLVPKAEFSPEENQRSERYLREHLGIRSPALLAYPRGALPPCPRTLEYLCRSKPPYGSANFGGSPATIIHIIRLWILELIRGIRRIRRTDVFGLRPDLLPHAPHTRMTEV